MMKYYAIITLLNLLPLITGCREEIITGPVMGLITTYDQYNNAEDDMSGVEVKFLRDSMPVAGALTEPGGRYVINDLQYGKYTVGYYREGYIMSYESRIFNHVGGGVPFYIDFSLYEVPHFSVHIDSVRLLRDYMVRVFLRIDGDTVLKSKNYSYFIAFASDSPSVSKMNYKGVGKGYFTNNLGYPYNTPVAVCGLIGDIGNIHSMASLDSVYLVVYPLAGGQGYNFDQYLDGALGQPSNILRCKWPRR
ncbi:MAG TPA: hypothetical protein VK207_04080 [Bacteroidales bacterium]|nr:hypothetical protein [Bacteroidales bacterium]